MMRKLQLLIITMITMQFGFAQASLNAIKSLPVNYEDAEIKPEFPGGFGEFIKFIGKNYITPEVEGLSGVVQVSFIVETSGKITEIKVLKDLGSGTGAEAIRVVSKSPNWTPGEQNGKPVRVTFLLPITIQGY